MTPDFSLYTDYPVSIHATLAGGDFCLLVSLYFFRVSIHATLAGGDLHNARCSQ